MKHARVLGVGLALWSTVLVAPAQAVTIDFVPDSPSVLLGMPLDVDVVISGLSDLAPPSLGAFDLNVSFDDTILSLSSVEFGDLLGDVSAFEAIAGSGPIVGGVNLFEISLLLDFELDALQPASFSLATLSFDAIGEGTSALALIPVQLGDGLGDPLAGSAASGSVRVVPGDGSVPEPSSVFLFLPGLLGLWWRRHAAPSRR